jgi:protoporphyrinogen oxidase
MSTSNRPIKVVVIAGAGPAGLTAAFELLQRSDSIPIVLEADSQVGGISKTVNYRGNRIDLGGHRFFSKSDWVMRWWQNILPISTAEIDPKFAVRTAYQGGVKEFIPELSTSPSSDSVMLVRQRLSRIFYRRRFFDYPLKINANTIGNMGIIETLRIGLSYGHAQLVHVRPEKTLEDFFINRFGDRLYHTFFKDYTEKVWGVPCREISAEWGAQRIKGLSITKALAHALTRRFQSVGDTSQKDTETSLIERFLYPKRGPGQMWEEVARRIILRGGAIHLNHRVVGIDRQGFEIKAIKVRDEATASIRTIPCDQFISTMSVRDLTQLLEPADAQVARIAGNLPYRDFMTAGLLLRKMNPSGVRRGRPSGNGMPPDNWIYIQEPDVRIGRLQIFNNWSPAMVADPQTIWLGLEYFCREGDDLWSMNDANFVDFAAGELEKIGLIDRRNVIDGTLVRVPKAYPAYFGEYAEFGKVRSYLDQFPNLYPVGRNGMHRYNNQDHSMLAANAAVDSIINRGFGKSEIWSINVEHEYHEEINSPDKSDAQEGVIERRTERREA